MCAWRGAAADRQHGEEGEGVLLDEHGVDQGRRGYRPATPRSNMKTKVYHPRYQQIVARYRGPRRNISHAQEIFTQQFRSLSKCHNIQD